MPRGRNRIFRCAFSLLHAVDLGSAARAGSAHDFGILNFAARKQLSARRPAPC
jgi:hypothetical protein